jgi:hypothetical protein
MMRAGIIWLLLAAATLLASLTSCGGGGGAQSNIPPLDGGNTTPTSQAAVSIAQLTSYLQAQAASLDIYASASKGSLKGTLAVKNYTILNTSTMQPLPAGGAIGKVPLRVVDPEDDVDGITYPSLNGTFLMRDLPVRKCATLKIDFYVAEDINGDHIGNDRVLCSIPIAISAGRQTYIQITLEPLSVASPIGGYVGKPVQMTYYYKGPDGTRTRKLALMGGGLTFMDSNNDGTFSAADIQFADSNNDGRSDGGTLAPPSGALPGSYEASQTIAGVITSYYGDHLTITDALAGTVELIISESTTIVDEFGVQVSISEYVVGKQAAAMIVPVSGGQPVTMVLMVFLNPQPAMGTP